MDEEFLTKLMGYAAGDSSVVKTKLQRPDGSVASVIVSTSGRVAAVLEPDGVQIARHLGPIGDLKITWKAFSAVSAVCRYWRKKRDSWALFETNSSGFPAGFGYGYRVQAPGKESEYELIGKKLLGKPFEGREFIGREVSRKPAGEALKDGFTITSEIWQEGEKETPPEGWPVGIICELADGYTAKARRGDLQILGPKEEDGRPRTFIEAYDDEIVEAVLKAAKKSKLL